MRVLSVYNNNNVVLALNTDGEELVVVGNGIGFRKKEGSKIDEKEITRTFHTVDENRDNLVDLLSRIPPETFEITQEIINNAIDEEDKIKNRLIIVLADHISIALERAKDKKYATNLVLAEIKLLYKEEYKQGLEALDIIHERTGIQLPQDEAGYIAMHLANAKSVDEEKPALIIHFIKDIMMIVRYSLDLELSEDDLSYYRLSTHLKFLGNRIFQNKHLNNSQDEQNYALYVLLKETNKKENRCVEQIGEYIEENYDYVLNDSEKLYLLIHISRFKSDVE